jgi:hypothetical protein
MTPDKPDQAILNSAKNIAGAAPMPPPVFAQDPTGRKPKQKSTTPTFLGSGSVPQQQGNQTMGKTLIGQ